MLTCLLQIAMHATDALPLKQARRPYSVRSQSNTVTAVHLSFRILDATIYNPFFWKDLTESTIDCSKVLYLRPRMSMERLLLYV